MGFDNYDEEKIRRNRKRKMLLMKKKRQQILRRRIMITALMVIAIILAVIIINSVSGIKKTFKQKEASSLNNLLSISNPNVYVCGILSILSVTTIRVITFVIDAGYILVSACFPAIIL